jgi:phosphate-selective porin OprO/OprP
MTCHTLRILVLSLALQGLSANANAQDAGESSFDRVWSHATLYENRDAGFVQKFALSGRLQIDGVLFEADEGDFDDAAWRRFRIGGKLFLSQDFVVHAEVDIDLNEWGSNDSYEGLTDSYIGWYPDKAFAVKVGKQSAGFTLDGATSSTKLLTMERSVVADNIWFSTEYFTGATGFGKSRGWNYKLGAFSSSGDKEFGTFDSGWFALASLGRDVSENVNLRLDYVYNDPDYSGDVGTANLKNVFSFVTHIEKGKAGLWTDLSFAQGIAAQSDLLGLQLMPFWSFNDTWQVVFRYAMVHSADGAGAKLGRYPRKIFGGKFEDVHDFFLGLNCFLYGHKLKWQSGLEYNYGMNEAATEADYRGWGLSTGLRVSW